MLNTQFGPLNKIKEGLGGFLTKQGESDRLQILFLGVGHSQDCITQKYIWSK